MPSPSDIQAVLAGTDLLLQLIDRLGSASSVLRQAHSQGRGVNAEELSQMRAQLDESLQDLDDAIARAKQEGR